MVSKLVSIKLRPEQYNYAKAQAGKQGISLSAYLRNITIGEVIKGTHHNNVLTISMLDECHKMLNGVQKKLLAIAQDLSNG
jgi:hypothetical protein